MRELFYISCFIMIIFINKYVILTRHLNSRKLIYMRSARKYFCCRLTHPHISV